MNETANAQSPNDVVEVLSALSDMNRYRIVELLSANGEELSCGAISGALGLSPSLLTHHLSVLANAGVIDRRKNGLWTLNRLRRDEVSRRLSGLHRILEPRLTQNGES
ncbi:MAG: ArsR/SmtB family transcription factor [Longimicrobiales bacterium]